MSVLRYLAGKFDVLLLIAGVAMLGLSVDYGLQMQKVDRKAFGPRHYLVSLMDRFGDRGGIVSVLLRKSTMVTPYLPTAPEGWQSHRGSVEAYWSIMADAQAAVIQRQWSDALADYPDLQAMSDYEDRLMAAYDEDVSATYWSDSNLVVLEVHDPNKPIATKRLRRIREVVLAHFAETDLHAPYGRHQGLDWIEETSVITEADDDTFIHPLRVLETRIGDVDLVVFSRASRAALDDFLDGLPLASLQDLSRAADVPAVFAQAGR